MSLQALRKFECFIASSISRLSLQPIPNPFMILDQPATWLHSSKGVKVIKGATDFSDVRHDDEENIDESLYGDDVFFEDDSLGEDLSLKYDEFCENDLDGEDEL